MSTKAYALPVFIRGTGLGNRLFQWARAKTWCYEHSAQMISPLWLRLSLGHLWRQTVPLDQYLGRIALAGLFRRDPRDLPILYTPLLRLRYSIEEETATPEPPNKPRPVIRAFNGREDSFQKLNRHQPRLKDDLLAIVAPRHRRRSATMHVPTIGINIRLGKDFAAPPPDRDYSQGYDWVGWLQQTPISWFRETLLAIRTEAGWPVPAMVVSDGTAQQLRPLLDLPAVSLLSPSNAIVDLLALSRTKLLLGSGSSSFSAWAAFLGQQTAITAPGHPFSNLKLEPLNNQTIAAFDPRNPDPAILSAMCHAIRMPPS